MKVLTIAPRGFCAGVRRAIEIVDVCLKRFGSPIYVRKEIVHNQSVVDSFRRNGVLFIDDVSEAPEGSTVVFSAHGVAPGVRDDARRRRLKTIDATCPLVTKVHLEVHRFLKEGYSLILIGHKDHDEVAGTMGEAPGQIQLITTLEDVDRLVIPNPDKIMILTQTTLSLDDTRSLINQIRDKYPKAQTPPQDDICYATQNRQDAVRELVKKGIELLLVVGSQNSSNSRRLCEVAREKGVKATLIDRASEIQPAWLKGVSTLGLTAGASAPEYLVQEVLQRLKEEWGAETEEIFIREENVVFSLPKDLFQTQKES
ncbi:MAG: 4-hydroxy-3-methylbut-2-enyl diphosphate reductase [Elusimicrobia bacterium]|nr:4-hydroxy-3-methylbut-2-enyl diphosphate reductase [Candidatus Obscuribacterium magneticum]